MSKSDIFEKLEKNRVYLIYMPLVFYWMCLILATSLPSSNMPSVAVNDKIEHFSAYFILSCLLVFTFRFQQKFQHMKRNPYLYAMFVIAVYAALDEIHQIFIPGRSCDIVDFIADVAGAALGLLLSHFLLKAIITAAEKLRA